MGLRGVGHVVPKDARVVDDALLDPRTPEGILLDPPTPPPADDPLVQLDDPERQKARVAFRPLDPRLVQHSQEYEPVGRVKDTRGHILEVDVVVVREGLVHLPLFPHPPAIRLGVQVHQLRARAAEEGGHLGRQRRSCGPSSHFMAHESPGRGRCRQGQPTHRQRRQEQRPRRQSTGCWSYRRHRRARPIPRCRRPARGP